MFKFLEDFKYFMLGRTSGEEDSCDGVTWISGLPNEKCTNGDEVQDRVLKVFPTMTTPPIMTG